VITKLMCRWNRHRSSRRRVRHAQSIPPKTCKPWTPSRQKCSDPARMRRLPLPRCVVPESGHLQNVSHVSSVRRSKPPTRTQSSIEGREEESQNSNSMVPQARRWYPSTVPTHGSLLRTEAHVEQSGLYVPGRRHKESVDRTIMQHSPAARRPILHSGHVRPVGILDPMLTEPA